MAELTADNLDFLPEQPLINADGLKKNIHTSPGRNTRMTQHHSTEGLEVQTPGNILRNKWDNI